MKKKAERIVAGILSLSMLMSICMPTVFAETLAGMDEPAATYVVVEPEVVTLEEPEGEPVATDTPSLEVTLDPTDESVDASVANRPEATPENPEVEWDLEIKDDAAKDLGEELGKEEIIVGADGSETYTPSEPVTDEEDRVIEEGGKTEGNEEINIEVTEKPETNEETEEGVKSDALHAGKPAEGSEPEGGDETEETPDEPGDSDKDQPKDDDEQTPGVDQPKDDSEQTPDQPVETPDKPKVDAVPKPVDKDKLNTTTGNTGSTKWDMTEEDLRDLIAKPTLPEGYDEDGTKKETGEDGTTTVKNWKIEDYEHTADGETAPSGFGYKVTETTTTTQNGTIDPDMSAKPEGAQDVTSPDGKRGYCYIESTTDENGVITETTYTVYPEQGTYTKTTTTTTTTLKYAKQTEKGEVTISNVKVTESSTVGGVKDGALSGLKVPKLDEDTKIPGDREVCEDTGLRGYYESWGQTLTKVDMGNGNFVWNVGTDGESKDVSTLYGSIYGINTSEGEVGTAKLYIVTDANGNKYYVYCADRGQGFVHQKDEHGKPTSNLTGDSYTLENLQQSGFFTDDQWKAIEEVATNGYWGTTAQDSGSLESFQKMLIENGIIDEIASELGLEFGSDVTEEEKKAALEEQFKKTFNQGMALTVTQAAIWAYASHSDIYTTENPFTTIDKAHTPNEDDWSWVKTDRLDESSKAILKAAYEILKGKGDDAAEATSTKLSTDLIDAEDITNVSVTVNNKLDQKGDDGKDVYDAELSFTMKVQPDRLNSEDLKVTVTLGDGQTYEYRLEGAAKNDNEKAAEKTAVKDNITYVLKGIQLPDGTTVSINLSGTQDLGKSAYLLTAASGYDKSQSFVGVFEGERNINLDVSFSFNADQPEATITTVTTEQTAVEQNKQTSWASSWLTKIFYPAKPEEPEETIPVVPEEPTPEVPEEEAPKQDEQEQEDLVVFPEQSEEVVDSAKPETAEPKVDAVPKTGDDAPVWMVLFLLSAAGLVLVNLPQKKTKH